MKSKNFFVWSIDEKNKFEVIGFFSLIIFSLTWIFSCNISFSPIINEVASRYGGGGHIFASGVKLESFDKVNDIVKDLDEVCKKYIEESK